MTFVLPMPIGGTGGAGSGSGDGTSEGRVRELALEVVNGAMPEFVGNSIENYVDNYVPPMIDTSINGLLEQLPGMIGITATPLINNKFAEAAANGETSWVYQGGQPLSGYSAMDLMGVPVDANEIIIKFQGLSPTGSANLCMQLYDDNGSLVTDNQYFGYASGASSVAFNPGTQLTVAPALVAADYISGQIVLRRHQGSQGGTFNWFMDAALFNSGSRNYFARGSSPNMGFGISGARLYLTSGAFDAGTAYIQWRR